MLAPPGDLEALLGLAAWAVLMFSLGTALREVTRKNSSPPSCDVVQRGSFPLPTKKRRSVCQALGRKLLLVDWLFGCPSCQIPSLLSSSVRLTDTVSEGNAREPSRLQS